MINYLTRHPTLANLIMLGFIVLGLSSLGSLKRETFPEFAPPYISASVVYPGASPIEVEESLCLRMEDAIDGLSNIEETKCQAVEGMASLIIKLNEEADLGRALVDVQTQITAVKDFPSEIESPIVKELDWAEPVVDIAISADTTLPQLKIYAEDVKRRLKIDAGVSLVSISGFSDHLLSVEINEQAIRRLSLTVNDIADKIKRQNVKMPSGSIELRDKNMMIRVDQQKLTPLELGALVISSNSEGGIVRLSDIATITDKFALDEEKILFDGNASAILNIKKNKADDALRIKAKVQEFVAQENLRAPEGVKLVLTNDLSSVLKDRLNMMLKNGWQGIILVFFSMWLFFSFRYSFWVSAGLPVAFLGGLFLMSILGLSINVMSLVGLLMAIGIMMDDAIVIAESIASHIDRGFSPHEAVAKGVHKVAPGVISSFLTTIFIFGSLLWLDGQMGAVLSVVPKVLILVLSISLIEAFCILPNHLNHSLSKQGTEKPMWHLKRRFLEKFENFRNTTLLNSVSFVVKWRYLSVGSALGFLLISFSLVVGGAVKFVAFPELDGDIAEARIILPPGSSLSQTEAVVDKIVASAKVVGQRYNKENDEPSPLIKNITTQFNFNSDAGENGAHLATVRLSMLSAEIRNSYLDAFIEDWRLETGELTAPISMVFKQPTMGPAGRDIELRLQDDDLFQLKAASQKVQSYLANFSGVHGILDDMRPGKEEINISLKPGAEAYGVDGQMIAQQLRSAYFGQTADNIQVGPENIEIEVRFNKQDAGDLHVLENFPIIMPNGNQLPLSAIADLDFTRSFVRISRVNGLRTVTVMAEVDNKVANTTEVLQKVRQQFIPQLQKEFPSLRVDFEGSSKETAKTGSSLLKGFVIGLFGLFAILSFQFRSYLEPFVVMLAIPLALIGVIWGHFILGHSLSMPSIMGFISLAGIVVNDSILLVQYIRHHVDEGDSVHQAVVLASRERFRAVFLTSLTTAAGLLPLLLETSLQAQIVQPLVISIVFGIFSSTLLVLFIIPSAYAILADLGVVHKHEEH